MQSTKGRRWIALLLGALAMTGAVVASTASPAQAAVSNCVNGTGPTYGAWSTSKSYTFQRGTFCIHEADNDVYRLVFQVDGNFVVYHNRSANYPADAVWSTRTNGSGNTLKFQTDGNLVIYNAAGGALWSTRTNAAWPAGTSFRLTLVAGSPTFSYFLPSGATSAQTL